MDVAWTRFDDSEQIESHHHDHTARVQNHNSPSESTAKETDSSAARIYTKPEAAISASHIEHEVRQQALMLYPKIHCHVTGVSVHFSSPNTVTVDCNIRLNQSITTTNSNRVKLEGDSSTLVEVHKHARELQWVLENNLEQVESARIYLDLNQEPATCPVLSG
jgi:hypothetical protein